MLIVISGGTGPIGQSLTAAYLKDGHTVALLSRSPEKYRSDFPEQVSLVQWDGRKVGDWANVLDGADVVFNLAGENLAGDSFLPDRWTEEKKQRIIKSRTDPGQALAEAIELASHKPRVLVQASGVNYYGTGGDEILNEQSPSGNDYLASVCRQWEGATAGVEAMGVRRVVTRIGLMLNADSGPLPRLVLPFKLFGGGYFGDGDSYYSWIHEKDVIRALRFVADNEKAAGPFNLVSPNPTTKRDFGKAIGKALNRPSWFPVPAFAMKLSLGEVATLVLDGQRAIPQELMEAGYKFQFPRIEEALTDILDD